MAATEYDGPKPFVESVGDIFSTAEEFVLMSSLSEADKELVLETIMPGVLRVLHTQALVTNWEVRTRYGNTDDFFMLMHRAFGEKPDNIPRLAALMRALERAGLWRQYA